VPKNNRAYWLKKVAGNRKRDQQNLERTTAAGWKALILWECDLRDEKHLKSQVRTFLEK
jgi:DNA mismatch endonuclease (patch repair protein)